MFTLQRTSYNTLEMLLHGLYHFAATLTLTKTPLSTHYQTVVSQPLKYVRVTTSIMQRL